MRQLRLCKMDKEFSFLSSQDMSLKSQQSVREYMESNCLHMKEFSYGENPAQIEIDNSSYLVGVVACEGEKIIKLPESGNVCMLSCEGGFILATEIEKIG